MSINKLIIRGNEIPTVLEASSADDHVQLKRSFVIGTSATRGVSEVIPVELEKDDMVELIFEDGTTWFSNTSSLQDVFPDASAATRSADGGFVIPDSIETTATERGIVSKIAMKVINIFAKKVIHTNVRELAKQLEKKQLENLNGIYRLDKEFNFQTFAPENSNLPHLLFLHGTGSSTRGSFGELIGSDLWNFIHQQYSGRVLAFQHETLSESPLYNTIQLIKQLPKNIHLHLISHSRGGLVGEVLCRFATKDETNRGFDSDEITYLKKAEAENSKESDTAKTSTTKAAIKKAGELIEESITYSRSDLQEIEAIGIELANKKITIEKFIRVACPASGTILASKRLDNCLNMIMNLVGVGTGIAATPIYMGFKNLISALVDCKNEKNILPGLEAMNPQSDFIKILNRPMSKVQIDSQLLIISGNCKLKINLKALVIIASKMFYMQENDLVVNTASMYEGSHRSVPAQYYFDHGDDVDHFHYFKNKRTTEAIMAALKTTSDTALEGFGRLSRGRIASAERNAVLGLDGGQIFTSTITGTKPILILLPGIMGSNLLVNDKIRWINYFSFITGGLKSLQSETGVTAPSIVRSSYFKLIQFLSAKYDVVTFPFDWRLQLQQSAAVFNNKVKELMAHNQPVKIVAHSMGGVLVRDFIINHRETWQQLNQSKDFKIVFLGVPLGGSFRIPAVLFGMDAIINKLSKIDIVHTKKELLEMFSQMPGLLSLLPISNTKENDFAEAATWSLMKEPMDSDWPVPLSARLQEFKKYRDNILALSDTIDYTNMVYIAGKDKATPCGYRVEEANGGKELVFLSTGEGDQSVTWEMGIPKKMIENDSVYYVDVSHGALANAPSIFSGISDILNNGRTNLLSRKRPVVRSTEKVFRSPVQEDFDLTEEGVMKTILGLEEPEESPVKQDLPLQVFVTNGDLRYATYPVIAGHFNFDGILYAEKEIDKNLNSALSDRHRINIYPGEIGTSEVFFPRNNDFAGAVIVGLGNFGELTAFQLSYTIQQGVSKYLLTLNQNSALAGGKLADRNINGLTVLTIGCGYGGLTVDGSIRAILQGVQQANAKVSKIKPDAVIIQEIEIIEQYEDTALNVFYSLNKMEKEVDSLFHILLEPKRIKEAFGRRKRISADTSANWWKRISVQVVNKGEPQAPIRCLQFSASTGGAREEQRELFSSTLLIQKMLEDISANNHWTPSLAKTIFELLIPNDFKEQIKKQGNINLILDKQSAEYPWELLQDTLENARPLCVNAGMIRQMSTQDYRTRINSVTVDNVLVIADPDLQGFIGQLPGAREEGALVNDLMLQEGYDTRYIANGSAPEIIEALFSKDYKIIHLAGHGLFNEKTPENSGMAIGKELFLSTREIVQMSTVPELVFVNCCYLGKTSGVAEAFFRNRYKLAANIGTQLIENGVKVVVVAGWAVDDAAALDFTKSFYDCMLTGSNFGDAILQARKVIYEKYHSSNNTWGAYQCYGDPFYKFKLKASTGAKKKYSFVISEQAEIELNNLRNKMEMGKNNHNEFLQELEAISTTVDEANIRTTAITEQEALTYADLYEYDLALQKFETLRKSEKATFTLSTLEKFSNIRAKKYVADFKSMEKKTNKYVKLFDPIINELESLLLFSATAERFNLLGSTYKRKAFVALAPAEKLKAYEKAAYYYMQANHVESQENETYALTNWYTLENILVLTQHHKWGQQIKGTDITLPTKEKAKQKLQELLTQKKKQSNQSDYWDIVAVSNLQLALLILQTGSGHQQLWDDLLESYKNIWVKAGTKGKKLAEIEQLELLLDALSLVNKAEIKLLSDYLLNLKKELEKMI